MAMIVTYLPWLLSAITIYTMFIAGDRKSYTWLVGLGNQALWLIWIVAAEAWGLIPMNLALWIVYARNHLKWRKASPTLADLRDEGAEVFRKLNRPDSAVKNFSEARRP